MKLVRRLLVVPGICCALSAVAEVPVELLTSPLAERFGAPPSIDRPRLSPDGSKMLYLTQDANGFVQVVVLVFETGARTIVGTGTEDGYDIGWCEWVNPTRLTCDLMVAVDDDGSDAARLTNERIVEPPETFYPCGVAREARAVEVQIDWLPEDPDHVSRYCGTGIRLNVHSGFRESLQAAFNEPGNLMSDGRGQARLRRWSNSGQAFDRWFALADQSEEWVQLHESNPQEFETPFRPVGFGSDPDALFHIQWDGTHWGLFGIDLSGDLQSRSLFTHPAFDVELVDTMGMYDRVVAAAYLDGRPQRFVVDAAVGDAYAAAIDAFPDQNLEIVDESWDGNVYLLLVREPRRAGRYYRLDLGQGTLEPIGDEYEHLADVDLAETTSIVLPVADGSVITAHLTLPPGRTLPAPTVVIPRPVPSRLDIADPHYLVQYLAASGYAVLRVNQRGPTEYGGWLTERATLGFEQGASDLADAAAFLIDRGVAAPAKVCALGRDLGAYAAFMTSIEFPESLSCIVSIGAVADSRTLVGADMLDSIVGDAEDLLRRGSPIRRAAEVTAPVLLFHGRFDGLVPMLEQTPVLHNKLVEADRESQFIEYPHTRHDIERRGYRVDMLTRIGAFLEEKIGP